jgi:hypothetical protein
VRAARRKTREALSINRGYTHRRIRAWSNRVNHDEVTDFTIANSYNCPDTCVSIVLAKPANGTHGVEGPLSTRDHASWAYALKAGAIIGPKRPFSGSALEFAVTAAATPPAAIGITSNDISDSALSATGGPDDAEPAASFSTPTPEPATNTTWTTPTKVTSP